MEQVSHLTRSLLQRASYAATTIPQEDCGPRRMTNAHTLHRQLHTMVEELLANLPAEATEDSDTFRNEILYTKACDDVLQVHELRFEILVKRGVTRYSELSLRH